MKKKNAAEANVPFTQEQYISVRNKLQGGTHRARLLDYLWNNGSITSMVAFSKLNNTRVGVAVHDLRQMGVPIETEMVFKKTKNGTACYGVYSIRRA